LRKFTNIFSSVMSVAMLMCAGTTNAALQAVGPTNPITTLPEWYQDSTGLALAPCVDQNNFCVLPPEFDPQVTQPPNLLTVLAGAPPISDLNWPNVSFFFLADSSMDVGPTLREKAVLRLSLEALFPGATPPIVVPGQGTTFLQINLQKMRGLTPSSTYTVTHPYGTFQFTTDAAGDTVDQGGQAFRTDDPVTPIAGVYFPPDLQNATTTHIGPFLIAVGGPVTDPGSGKKYIGNPNSPTFVTGSPTGNNVFRINGPDIGGSGVDTIETPLFALTGKIVGLEVTQPAGGNDFGAWQLNATVPAKTYTITNFTGANAGPLVLTPQAPYTVAADTCSGVTLNPLAPGNSCTFDVVFTPVANGVANGTITVSTPNSSAVINVTGAGDSTAPTLTLNAPPFTNLTNLAISGTVSDNVAVGAVQVSSNGGAPTAATVTGGTWSFNVVGLTPNGNSISVTANDTAQPAANQSAAQTATITQDSINPSVNITSPVGTVNVAAPALTYTAIDANNIVSTIVTLDNVILPSVPLSLGPLVNGSHTVKVDVTDPAGNPGTNSSTFNINHGPALALTPSSAPPSGNVSLTIPTAPTPFTITNTGNSGLPLSLTSIASSGTDSAMFHLENGSCGVLPINLVIGASCNFLVTFAPTSTGPKSANVTVTVSAIDEPPAVLAFSGTGVSNTNTVARTTSPALVNFNTLNEAFTAATGNTTIQAMNSLLTATALSVNSTGTVNFSGGYDAIYGTRTGLTAMHGDLTVRKGTLVVDNLIIQ
jgi:hypothetical protein